MASKEREREIQRGLFRYLDKHERWVGLSEVEAELSDPAFMKTFVQVWADNEGNDLNLSIIDALVDKRGVRSDVVMPLLSKGDRQLLDALRENPIVYRGSTAEEPYSDYSWTTDRDQAIWFAERSAAGTPVVITGTVNPDDILFAYAGRNESEIAVRTPYVNVIDIEELGEAREDERTALYFMAQHGKFDDLFPPAEMLRLQLQGYMMNRQCSFEEAADHYAGFIDEFVKLGFVSAARKRRGHLDLLLLEACPDIQCKTA